MPSPAGGPGLLAVTSKDCFHCWVEWDSVGCVTQEFHFDLVSNGRILKVVCGLGVGETGTHTKLFTFGCCTNQRSCFLESFAYAFVHTDTSELRVLPTLPL